MASMLAWHRCLRAVTNARSDSAARSTNRTAPRMWRRYKSRSPEYRTGPRESACESRWHIRRIAPASRDSGSLRSSPARQSGISPRSALTFCRVQGAECFVGECPVVFAGPGVGRKVGRTVTEVLMPSSARSEVVTPAFIVPGFRELILPDGFPLPLDGGITVFNSGREHEFGRNLSLCHTCLFVIRRYGRILSRSPDIRYT